jgi:hypothetical protein
VTDERINLTKRQKIYCHLRNDTPSEIKVKDNKDTQRSASYRNLYLDNRGRLKSKRYDKRDEFTFPIVTFPFIGSNILAAPAVGV